MPSVPVLNQEGTKVSAMEISDAIFGIVPHKQALFDVLIMQKSALRQGTHKVKTRGEVRGGGRKPWRQKGTGRARQGSIRSPQFRGGGVVFGPQPRSYTFRINKKVYRLALRSILSEKVLEDAMFVIDTIAFEQPKTKQMMIFVTNIGSKKTLIVDRTIDKNTALSTRNIPNASYVAARSAGVLDFASFDVVVLTKDAVAYYEEVLSS